ncbi:MAG: hypothetical protein KGL48_05175 [Sphingomonadales bacterium]|nr:hypothetical protein [Sphingomonadales bacterium]MDE2570061.1 hypothetical protein [Sphingomonadales bacterium]
MRHHSRGDGLRGGRPFGSLARILRDSGANVSLLIAVAIVPCIGAVGLGTDTAQWILWRRQLQNAADAAAMAGAYALVQGQDANAAARQSLAKNEEQSYSIDLVESPPSTGVAVGDHSAVRVVLHTQRALPFSSIFLKYAPRVGVASTAAGHTGTPACVLALDPTAAAALTASGSASITASCGMRSNSNADPAADFGNNPVNVSEIAAVGSISAGSGISASTKLYPHVGPMLDPFATLPMPDFSTLCAGAGALKVKSNQSKTVSPGCYTDISVLGDANFSPGVYYIDGGDFSIAANAAAAGDGVTFLFSSSAVPFDGSLVGRVNFNGSSIVDLTAPETGTYAGVLFYQDRRTAPSNATVMQVAGTSGLGYAGMLQGAIYAPATTIRFNGTSTLNTNCVQFVGRIVTFSGNTSVSNQCPPGSGSQAFAGRPYTQLVG